MEKRVIITKKRKFINSKLIIAMIVLGIFYFLLWSAPAQAFILGLFIPDNIAEKGEIINFSASVQMQDSETPDNIDYLVLRLTGPEEVPRNFECRFLVNGTQVDSEGCRGIKIQKINSSEDGYSNCGGYDYGYGYPPGYNNECTLNYSISLDTGKYTAGRYKTKLIVKDDVIEGKDIIITVNLTSLKKCSIRAFDGSLNVDEKNFTNNKINFYTYQHNDFVNGRGSLTGQKGRERFNYRFKIEKIIENDPQHAVIFVTGDYRLGKGDKISENVLIYFDKINNKIIIDGEDIQIKSMNINFRDSC